MAKLKITKKENPPEEGPKKLVGYIDDHIRTPANDSSDARDILSMFVGGGHTALNSEDLQFAYKRLTDIVGKPMAQKLSNQAFLHSQRPDTQKMNPEQRVQNFFDTGSNDPEVAQTLKNYRGLASGQLHAFRTSPLLGNRGLLGQSILPASTDEVAATGGSAQQKIKLLLRQNAK